MRWIMCGVEITVLASRARGTMPYRFTLPPNGTKIECDTVEELRAALDGQPQPTPETAKMSTQVLSPANGTTAAIIRRRLKHQKDRDAWDALVGADGPVLLSDLVDAHEIESKGWGAFTARVKNIAKAIGIDPNTVLEAERPWDGEVRKRRTHIRLLVQ